MTQNNERELLLKIKYAICMAIYSDDGLDELEGENIMKEIDKYLSPISQNEHQEAVAERDKLGYAVVEVIGNLDEIIEVAEDIEFNDFAHIAIPLELWNELKDDLELMPERADNYTSPPKQIPEGWISVNDRLPDNDYEVVFVLLNDLSCGTTFSYEDAKTSLDDKTVDICFIRDGNKWGCSQGTYDLEKIKYWMSIPRVAPTTILTRETNTEVVE